MGELDQGACLNLARIMPSAGDVACMNPTLKQATLVKKSNSHVNSDIFPPNNPNSGGPLKTNTHQPAKPIGATCKTGL